jgi:hypothetical protein
MSFMCCFVVFGHFPHLTYQLTGIAKLSRPASLCCEFQVFGLPTTCCKVVLMFTGPGWLSTRAWWLFFGREPRGGLGLAMAYFLYSRRTLDTQNHAGTTPQITFLVCPYGPSMPSIWYFKISPSPEKCMGRRFNGSDAHHAPIHFCIFAF